MTKRAENKAAEPDEILAEAIRRDAEMERGQVKPLPEYGLTRVETNHAVKRMKLETQRAKAKGELISLDELAASLPPRASGKPR